MDKLFVIAIGGTGMRCLEAFTHLCAVGMLDNQEIEVLTLDTDQTNGNKARTEQLIELYGRIKSYGGQVGGTPNANTFFSAKLNLHRFWTNYSGSGRETYRNISKLATGGEKEQEDNRLLSNLFLEKNTVQEFNLAHGYRAQTHLGSHLMYHGIIEAARDLLDGRNVKTEQRDLETFLNKLEKAGADARVFVFGSVFGGTGASSIPVIPKAFQDFARIRSQNKSNIDLSKTKFGATLLTEYFTFKKPDAKQMATKENSVVADASFFPLNSQAALQFYQNDPTVKHSYKRLYHIGWPVESKPLDKDKKEDQTITGGAEQKNPCHVTEMLCACAAFDFFTRQDGFDMAEAEYVYKAVDFRDNSFHFQFADLVGQERKADSVFANRLGAFYSLAHIVLSLNGGARGDDGIGGFITRLDKQKITDYNTITEQDKKEINEYFRAFGYSMPGEVFLPGWFYQVRSTVAPGTFLFRNDAFTANPKELKGIDVGEFMEGHEWPGGGLMSASRYDNFVKKLVEVKPKPEQNVNDTKEKLMAHIFNAITASQGFELN
jgi:hypothetical protein